MFHIVFQQIANMFIDSLESGAHVAKFKSKNRNWEKLYSNFILPVKEYIIYIIYRFPWILLETCKNSLEFRDTYNTSFSNIQ